MNKKTVCLEQFAPLLFGVGRDESRIQKLEGKDLIVWYYPSSDRIEKIDEMP